MFHQTGNKTGFWFTTTFTGTGEVLPIKFTTTTPTKPLPANPTTPTTTSNAVTTSATPAASGQFRVWFGSEDNKQNAVLHATISFKGTTAAGKPVSLNGHFDVTTNANGKVTATPAGISCS